MQNLEWNDKIDKESDIEAKDVNSLANAIITIIDWINQGGADVDLSDYVKKGTEGDNYIVDVSTASWGDEEGTVYEIQTKDKNGQPTTVELFASDDVVREYSDRLPTSNAVYTALAEKPSMSEVKAYIEETLLGGAW